MRISDWSSDVCSSDLGRAHAAPPPPAPPRHRPPRSSPAPPCRRRRRAVGGYGGRRRRSGSCWAWGIGSFPPLPCQRGKRGPGPPDRKSVVEGKSVSVRVDLVGRRIIKKKKKNN